MTTFTDLSGCRFTRWLVLERADTSDSHTHFLCRCDCGTERNVMGRNLTSGSSRSCGCLARELAANRAKHRLSDTPEYRAWYRMHTKAKETGIDVCERWHSDNPDGFQNFLDDLGPKPDGYSLLLANGAEVFGPDSTSWQPTKGRRYTNGGTREVVASRKGSKIKIKARSLSRLAAQLRVSRQSVYVACKEGSSCRGWLVHYED